MIKIFDDNKLKEVILIEVTYKNKLKTVFWCEDFSYNGVRYEWQDTRSPENLKELERKYKFISENFLYNNYKDIFNIINENYTKPININPDEILSVYTIDSGLVKKFTEEFSDIFESCYEEKTK